MSILIGYGYSAFRGDGDGVFVFDFMDFFLRYALELNREEGTFCVTSHKRSCPTERKYFIGISVALLWDKIQQHHG